MHNLVQYAAIEKYIGRGRILRFPGDGIIHEQYLDLMVVNNFEPDRGMTLIVVSGYKAGHVLVILPVESLGDANGAIDANWLVKNFAKWVYEDVDPSQVFVLDRPPVPAAPASQLH